MPDERYTWEGWWTIWLPGLYVAECLLIQWKLAAWTFSKMARLVRSRRFVT
jgi:hypothetical protein